MPVILSMKLLLKRFPYNLLNSKYYYLEFNPIHLYVMFTSVHKTLRLNRHELQYHRCAI